MVRRQYIHISIIVCLALLVLNCHLAHILVRRKPIFLANHKSSSDSIVQRSEVLHHKIFNVANVSLPCSGNQRIGRNISSNVTCTQRGGVFLNSTTVESNYLYKNASTCALLFYGLPKHFADIVLPSIRKHILSVNPTCDIFMHMYNVSLTTNPRNNEMHVQLYPNEVFLLQEATKILSETESDFHRQRNVSYFRKYFPWNPEYGYLWPTSMDNMIKQWHSIAQVWNLMVIHEQRVSQIPPQSVFQYQQVGLFRSDVVYTNDINIGDGAAVTALFNNNHGYMSDRLFYGLRQHGEKWACGRFEYVEKYMNTDFGKFHKLHSERYLFHLLGYWNIPMEYRDVCVRRVRATGRIQNGDCLILKKTASWKHDYSLMDYKNGK